MPDMRYRLMLFFASVAACISCSTSPQVVQHETPYVAKNSERHTDTYRLMEQTTTSSFVLSEKPTIFLIGETHLGKSQIEVAKIATQTFKEHEIDAVFVEQPDTLKFDWTPYTKLRGFRDSAVAAIQQRMLNDANRPTTYDWGKFKPLIDSYQHHKDDQRLSSEIVQKFGAGGMDELTALMDRQKLMIEDTNKLYNNGEYVSAFDYLFLMLNLEGVDIPFWSVESLQRRKEFTVPETAARSIVTKALAPRDAYMADKIDTLTRQYGYKQTVLVCGALHIPSLPNLLQSRGYTVKILYDSLEGKGIKHEMAILTKPDYVLDIAQRGPRSDFKVSDAYIVRSNPSWQILTNFDQFMLQNKTKGFWGANESRELRARFIDQYEKYQARSKPSWTLDLVTQSGMVIRTSRNLANGSFIAAALGPIEAASSSDPGTLIPTKPVVLSLADFGSHFEVTNPQVPTQVLYKGLSIPEIARLANNTLKQDPRRTVYIDLYGLPADKVAALSTSLRIQFAQPDKQVSVRAYSGLKGSTGQDLFFAADARLELKSPQIEQINSGEHSGWFTTTIEIGTAIGRATLQIIARSAELIQQALAILRELAGSPRFTGTSIAGLISEARWELKSRHGLSDQDVLLQFRDQFSNTQFVWLSNSLMNVA
jgi:hypothetical protein